MKTITRLTVEQESKIPEWGKKWVDVGLSTEPADFDKAIAAAKKAYSLCGLDQPLVILKVGSPCAATMGGIMAYEMLKAGYSDNWKRKAGDESLVYKSIQSRVYSNIQTNIYKRAYNSIGHQIHDKVYNPVYNQIYNVVSRSLHLGISEKTQGRVREQVRGGVKERINNQVGSRVNLQVKSLVWDDLWELILKQVGGSVWRKVYNKVSDLVYTVVGGQVRSNVYDQVRAQIDSLVRYEGVPFSNEGLSSLGSSYASYLTFFRDVCKLELSPDTLERISITEDLVTSCGWSWWHENVLVISDRPKKINLDAENRLHCDNGPSIEYRDGWSLYHWHGVSIPEEWIMVGKPTAKEALTWENIEQRRAACEIVGWTNVLKELDAETIDEDGDPEIGTLVECSIPDSGKERFLRVVCGTSREFVIPVPREMETAIEANSWTWGLSPNEYKPEIRT